MFTLLITNAFYVCERDIAAPGKVYRRHSGLVAERASIMKRNTF